MSPSPDRRERDALIESATTAWRPQHGRAEGVRAHPAWSDLDAAGRAEVYERTRLLRRLEAALDPDGLSTMARKVLALVRGD